MIVATLAGLFAFTSVALAGNAGGPDRSFGQQGVVLSRLGGHRGYANAVAVGQKDKPVVAGVSGRWFGVVRYTRGGKVDSSFGKDGVKTAFADTGHAYAYAVDVGKKGAVVAAGQSCHDTGCYMALARYDPKGQLDKGFGNDGLVELSFGTNDNTASAVTFTQKGRIIVAGSTCPLSGPCDFVLARLLPNGDPDPAFGSSGNGKVVTSFEDKSGDPITAKATSLAIDSRNRIAVGGYSSNRLGLLALYKPRGHVVRSFGHDGKVVKDLPHLGAIEGVATDAKDKIVAAGVDKKQPGGRWALASFGKQGGLDSSFGNDGGVVTGFPGPRNVHAVGVAIDSKDRIVVAGTPNVSLARYQPNGNLNKSFGHKGRVTRRFGATAAAVAIDSRNRPVVAGFNAGLFAVARFLG
jgi:uncharacterized delta-60 repeat protein